MARTKRLPRTIENGSEAPESENDLRGTSETDPVLARIGPARPANWRERRPVNAAGPSRVQQHLADQCNINRIVQRYGQSGVWDHLAPVAPTYGDFSRSMDLAAAYELADELEAEFEALPASVREAAENDPELYFEMLASAEGTERLAEAGLPILDPDSPDAAGGAPPQPMGAPSPTSPPSQPSEDGSEGDSTAPPAP